MALKGRSQNKEAWDVIGDVLICKHLNISPYELDRLPYKDKVKWKLVISTILNVKPGLLTGFSME